MSTSHPTQTTAYDACIEGAQLKINDTIQVVSQELIRSTTFETQKKSSLFDLVSRFVVLSNDRSASISGETIKHNSRNIYHQHAIDSATVPIGEKHLLKFSNLNTIGHQLFEQVFYIRDESIELNGMKRWIIHHRLIVKPETTNLIVRCCHPRFEGPTPLQTLIPHPIKKRLFRIREHSKPNFPFMAVGESPIASNTQIVIGTRVQIIND